jgi:nucleoside-diphosphate-sugar epimerase
MTIRKFPEEIPDREVLTELLSRPSPALTRMMKQLDGDFIFLGVGGKMGPTMAEMALRAAREAGVSKRIIGVSRFSNPEEKEHLEKIGVETISGDLLDKHFLERLPRVKNVIFLAGMKFGAEGNLPLTWAMNTYLPALTANYFTDSRIVALSTGTVYSLVPVSSGGSREDDLFHPVGEYAQSCLGRERMFQYGSDRYGNPVAIIRLNYAVEMRYGVLADIAMKVFLGQPVDLAMGYFNAIWQGDANDMILRSLEQASSPALILNLTGPEILSVRETAEKFGELFNKRPLFEGRETETALLNNASKAFSLLGRPVVGIDEVIRAQAGWILAGRDMLNKPTHFEVRDGKF